MAFQPLSGGFTAINADPNSTFRPRFRRLRSDTPVFDRNFEVDERGDHGAEHPDHQEEDDNASLDLSSFSDDALEALYDQAFTDTAADEDSPPNETDAMDVNFSRDPVENPSRSPQQPSKKAPARLPASTSPEQDALRICAVGRIVGREDCFPEAVHFELEDHRSDKNVSKRAQHNTIRQPEAISLLSSPNSSPKSPNRSLTGSSRPISSGKEPDHLSLNDDDFHEAMEAVQDVLAIDMAGAGKAQSQPSRDSQAPFWVPPPPPPPPHSLPLRNASSESHPRPSKHKTSQESPQRKRRVSRETQLPTPPSSSLNTSLPVSAQQPTPNEWRRTSFPDRLPLYPSIPGFSRDQLLRVFPRTADALTKGKIFASEDASALLVVYGHLIFATRNESNEQFCLVEDIKDESAPVLQVSWTDFGRRPVLAQIADELLDVSAGGAYKFVEATGCFEWTVGGLGWVFKATTMWEVGLEDMRSVAHIHDLT